MRAFLLILSTAALAAAQNSLPLSLKRAVEIALLASLAHPALFPQ